MKFKRPLVLVLVLALAMSAVTGGTIAWFTDEVTSETNVIKAGNLDIEVSYKQMQNGVIDSDWTDLQDSGSVFSSNLWEPGHTEVVYLKVENKGTLALNYKTSIAPVGAEIEAMSVKGNQFKLSDYLVFGMSASNDNETTYATAEAARSAIKYTTATEGNGTMGLKQDVYTDEVKLSANDTDYVALVVYMPESVGNEANYRPVEGFMAPPQVNLGISVEARQATEEYDSFDDQYDVNATYDIQPTGQLNITLNEVNALDKNVIATIKLDADEAYTGESLIIKEGNTITIDLAGHDLDIANSTADVDAIIVNEGATLNLINTGDDAVLSIKAADEQAAIRVNGGTLNVETKVDLPGDDNTIIATGDAVVNIKDGAELSSAAENNNVISLQGNAIGNMDGGVIKAKYDPETNAFAAATAISLDSDNAVFNMSAGEIYVLGNHTASGISTTMLPNATAKATINVTGGKIYVQSENATGYMAGIEAGSGSTINLSGAEIYVDVKNARGASAVYTTKSVNLNIASTAKINVKYNDTDRKNSWAIGDWDDIDLVKEYKARTGSFTVDGDQYTEENRATLFNNIVSYQ